MNRRERNERLRDIAFIGFCSKCNCDAKYIVNGAKYCGRHITKKLIEKMPGNIQEEES